MKTIIIEPDNIRLRQLRTILSSLGHKSADIEAFGDAKSALGALRKKRFEFSFVVLSHGSFSGIETLSGIRGISSAKDMPVIIYSPEVTKENVVAAHEAGSNGFLAYPFSVSDVEAVIHKATSAKK